MGKLILSGMRPTGPMHLGHLVGALKNWVDLQDSCKCFYMVADWHAFMSEYESPKDLKAFTRQIVADWLACGIDPERSAVFVQSHVPEHLELDMILSCLTPLGWLERCPTYKEQMREVKKRDLSTYAFLGYPVLQAADILLYKATHVPVGEDQLAHLELTREITRRFNKLYGKTLAEPQPILTKTPRLLGTDNRKMSKSYDNYVALSADENEIKSKISKMMTDPNRIKRSDKGNPDICSVFSYQKVFAKETKEDLKELRNICASAERGCVDCKIDLAEKLTKLLRPIKEKSRALLSKKNKIDEILSEGAKYARKLAQETLAEVKEKIGL